MNILRKSNNVGQMMKVVGEEGTSGDEFVDYLKGELFDGVYLQQNAFDKADEATSSERQGEVFEVVHKIIMQKFHFEGKDVARRYFQELRQIFINWNSAEYGSEDFKKRKQEVQNKVSEAKAEEQTARG